MVGQDRGEHFGFSGRGGGGGGGTKGGDAGSRNKPGQDVAFIRHVPKFLQVPGLGWAESWTGMRCGAWPVPSSFLELLLTCRTYPLASPLCHLHQAHAHMLGKPVEEEPEAALLNQKFNDGRGGRGHEAEEEDDDEQVGAGWIFNGVCRQRCMPVASALVAGGVGPTSGRRKSCCLPFPSPRARRAVSWSCSASYPPPCRPSLPCAGGAAACD